MPATSLTLPQVAAALDGAGLAYATLTWPSGAAILITERGGRIFGPFLDAATPSLTWINPAFADADALRAFVASGDWNMGGERVWIAPEIQYHVTDRARFWETIRVPPAMDPGAYRLDAGRLELAMTLTQTAHNLATGQKTLEIRRAFRQVADPLRALRGHADLTAGVTYLGYEQAVQLSETITDAIVSESWNLVQLNPGGTLVIPSAPGVEASDYFGDVPAVARAINGGALRIPITGSQQFKVGYKAAYMTGRMGYVQMLADGRACLLARNFFNNPSAIYSEEVPDTPGANGHSVHVYNDDGALGGFGEMEASGQTLGGASGQSHSSDTFTLWVYVGPAAAIREIGAILLGVAL